MEQVRHLLDMTAADEAAEKANNKKRAAAAAAESNDDDRAKLTKVGVEDSGFKHKVAVSAVGVACF
jgi:cleavage stimulation factor subunit 2